MTDVEKIACAGCGGPLSTDSGRRRLQCGYCGAMNLVITDDPYASYMLEPIISARDAGRKAKKTIRQTPGRAQDLADGSRFDPPELFFIPIYETEGLRIGRFEEKKIDHSLVANHPRRYPYQGGIAPGRTPTSSPALQRATTIDTRIVMGDTLVSRAAVRLRNWGIDALSMRRLRKSNIPFILRPLDIRHIQKLGTVIAPGIAFDTFFENATRMAPTEKKMDIQIVDRQNNLVYYPVYRIGYRYREIPYQIVIDAMTGDVLFARLPQDTGRRILVFLAAVGSLGLAAAGTAELLTGNTGPYGAAILIQLLGTLSFFIMIFLLVVISAIVSTAWASLRFPGEIVLENGKTQLERVGKTADTRPEKVLKWALDRMEKIEFNSRYFDQ